MAYGSTSLVRKYARGITSDIVADADITAFLEAATSIIDTATGHPWTKTTGQVEYHDGDSHDRLLLDRDHRPVLQVTSIEKRVNGAWVALDEFDELTGEGDYLLLDGPAGIIEWTSDERATSGTRAIKVTYNHGYDPTPDYIDALASIMAAINALGLAAGTASPSGLTSITEGALSLSWGGGPYRDTIADLQAQADRILARIIGRRLSYVPSRG